MLLLMMIDWRVWGSRVDVTPPSGSKLQFWSNLGGSEKYGSRGRFSWTSGVNENIQFSKQEARQERDCNSFKTVFKNMHDQRKHWHLPCCSLVWRLKCQPGLNTWNWLQSVTKQNRLNYKTEKKQGSNLNYQTVLATLLTLGVNWKSIPCCCYTCYSLQNPSQQNPAILFLSRYDAHLCRHSHYVVLFASCLVLSWITTSKWNTILLQSD